MIKFNNVSFAYENKKVLNEFNLEINKGDKICLFGKSGCGKTTVLRLILGLETPQSGEILKPHNLKSAVVFQENRLLPFKTVLENVSLFADSEKTALHHLEALDLLDNINSYPSELSGGMQRRVAIARALSYDFNILVLDEAFTGLDEENRFTAAKHILKIADNRPIVLVTHSKSEAELFSAKIINM